MEFRLTPVENPYIDEASAKFELWGQIELLHDDAPLFTCQWDVLTLIEWFIERRTSLESEVFPLEGFSLRECTDTTTQPKCIAEKFDILRIELRDIDEEMDSSYYDDILADYWENHYFLLRGSKIPSFFIGLNNGAGEISYYDEQMKRYTLLVFDMTKFLRDIFDEMDAFVSAWKTKYYTLEAAERLRSIGYKT